MNRAASRRLALPVLFVFIVCFAGCGCGDEVPAPPSMDAEPPEAKAVRATMKEGSWERTLKAGTTPAPNGKGTLVTMGNGRYLVKDGTVYAINREAKAYSPAVPLATDAKVLKTKPPAS